MNTAEIAAYMDDLAREHGAGYKSADANSQAGLEARWRVLSEVCDLRSKSVLDVGCGTGGLAQWLQERYYLERPAKLQKMDEDDCAYLSSYTGIDISAEAVAVARAERPAGRFEVADLMDWTEPADVVLAQGVFYLMDDMNQIYTAIEKMWGLAREAVAFTALDDWSGDDDGYLRIHPESLLGWIRRNITKNVTFRHDYGYDSCFYLRK